MKKHWYIINRNADPGDTGGSEEKFLGELSEEEESKLQNSLENPIKEEEPEEEEEEEEEKEENNGSNTEKPEEEEEVLKIEEEEEEEEEILESFSKIGEELGLPIEEDSIEGLKAAIKKQNETALAEAEKKLKDEVLSFQIEKYAPEAQLLIKALDTGMTIEEFLNPAKEFDNMLALSTEDRMKAYLEAKGYDEKLIEEEMARLVNSGDLELEDKKVQALIQKNRAAHIARVLEDRSTKWNDIQEKRKNETAKDNEAFKSALKEKSTFNNQKVAESSKDIILKRWENGYYKQMFAKNPEVVIDAIMQIEFGKKVAKEIEEKAAEKGKKEIKSKLANDKPKNDAGSKKVAKKATNDEDDEFAEWEEGLNQQ